MTALINNDITVNDRIFGDITIRCKNGKIYIDGRLTFQNKTQRVHKSTGYEHPDKYKQGVFKGTEKKRVSGLRTAKQNFKYVENNKEDLLWKLSNHNITYTAMQEAKANNKCPLISDFYQVAYKTKLENNNITPETYNEYMQKYNTYIAPYFNGKKLNEVKTNDIEEWQLWVVKKFNRKNIKDIRSALNIIFDKAKKAEHIEANPLLNAEYYQSEKAAGMGNEDISVFVFTDYEMNMIVNNIDKYINDTTHKTYIRNRKQLKNMIFLAYGTGIRTGEMVSLQWSDIDFNNKKIDINKTIRKGRIKSTKTSSGKRVIDMNEDTYKLLKEQKKLSREQNSEFVFLTYQNNNYTNPAEVSKGMWKTFLKFCNIEYRRFYSLRHTYATNYMLLDNSDTALIKLSAQLGHSDIQVTAKKYVKNKKQNEGAFINISLIKQFQLCS